MESNRWLYAVWYNLQTRTRRRRRRRRRMRRRKNGISDFYERIRAKFRSLRERERERERDGCVPHLRALAGSSFISV